ncbi:unnamed protein product [Triticum turgidum subsp. durum]|uniref:NPH3 domain-containing protein n=1 Tax=Triticum turgidum subsp. durum TaxID=4567 RepID=A0A9R0Q3K0_TRITD|nr:unnamed protein product [Triticum turgidum subsp. durum]
MNPPSPTQCSSSPSPRATVEPTGAHYSSPDPRRSSTAAGTPPRGASDDACVAISDVDAFARTIAAIRSKPQAAAAASPSSDHLASVMSHYAARWLPDVAASSPSGRFQLPPESPTATWLKKRLLLESLVAALPPDDAAGEDRDDGIACDFLLRLLRAGSMVGADAALLGDLEARAARRLDQASLGAVMIPAFGLQGPRSPPPDDDAAGRAPSASSGARVPAGGRQGGRRRRGGRQGGEAGGRVPLRGGAGGRAAAGGVRGARARRARVRPRRRRRAVPRRGHLP